MVREGPRPERVESLEEEAGAAAAGVEHLGKSNSQEPGEDCQGPETQDLASRETAWKSDIRRKGKWSH